MLNRKPSKVPHADLIDLLLDSDEPTRKLLIFQALQTGDLKKSQADELIAWITGLRERITENRLRRCRTGFSLSYSRAGSGYSSSGRGKAQGGESKSANCSELELLMRRPRGNLWLHLCPLQTKIGRTSASS